MTYERYKLNKISCTKVRSGIDFETLWYPAQGSAYFIDYHRFAESGDPFNPGEVRVTDEARATAANLSLEDGLTVFRNPWNWVAEMSNIKLDRIPEFDNPMHPYLWRDNLTLNAHSIFTHCNSTGTYHPAEQPH